MRDTQTSIRMERVGLRVSGQQILDGINWTVETGARAAILGPNGSGKTSLLRILTGYRYPSEGAVYVLGEQLGRTCLETLRRRIGLVDPTLAYLCGDRMSALDVVLSGFFGHFCLDFDMPTNDQISAARAMLSDVGLEGKHQRVFATLSTGEQRRALLARAMTCEPSLLILDEATAGLDIVGRETLLATVDQLASTRHAMSVLIVTHHLEELLPGTSDVLLLREGRSVVSGRTDQVLTSRQLSTAFGVPITVSADAGRWTWRVEPAVWPSLLRSKNQ